MSEALNKLYDAVIREHHAKPHHFEKKKNFVPLIKSSSPVCGDRFEFYPVIENGNINAMYFHGFGCSVSMASGSVLTKTLEGKTVSEAILICEAFINNLATATDQTHPEFNSFAMVKDFPARYECAALAWTEMKKFLSNLPR